MDMRWTIVGIVAIVGLLFAVTVHAADPAAHADAHAGNTEEAVQQQPVLPNKSAMPGVTVIVILGLFLAAAVIGPIVRANLPEEIPVTHSHDEPPGASHHHGASGTH